LEDIDDMLFKLDREAKTHLRNVIFFVYSHFVESDTKEIKQPYKDIIKRITRELELKPLGYIECYEAVASHLQKKDAAPLNATLVELDKTNFGVFVFRGGKCVFMRSSARTDNFVADFLEVLKFARSHNVLLPSRVVLYDSSTIDKESTKILTHQWDPSIFIQLPRVEIVKEEQLHEELGQVFVGQMIDSETETVSKQIHHEPPKEEIEETEEHHRRQKKAVVEEEKEEEEPAEVMGFVIGGDVAPPKAPLIQDEDEESEEEEEEEEEAEEEEKVMQKPKHKKSPLPIAFPLQFNSLFKKFHFKKGKLPKLGRGSPILVIGGIGVVILLLVLMGTGELLFHKATVTVTLPSQSLDKELDVNAALDGSGAGDLPLRIDNHSEDVSLSKATTGTKQVGDKAKGQVTIHNFNDRERSYSKGTTLTVNGLSYILQQDVRVSSASEGIVGGGVVKQPGKAKADVVAGDIGPQYNLDKLQRFKIGDLTTTNDFALNEDVISGGTKREIKVVSKKDLDDLKSQGMDKAKNQGGAQPQADEKVLDSLTDSTLTNVKFSHDVNDEANDVALTAKAQTNYYLYSDNKVKEFISSALQPEVQSGFKLDKTQLTFDVKQASKSATIAKISMDVHANAVKDISLDQVKSEITGKSKDSIVDILKSAAGTTNVSVDNSTPIFFFNGVLPFFKNNIDIKVKS
jgi:hypothetical protein